MCEDHICGEGSGLRKSILRLYGTWIGNTLSLYLFFGKMTKLPLVGGAVRYFAHRYSKHLHGSRVATKEECLELLANADYIAVTECTCRELAKACEKPKNICIRINAGKYAVDPKVIHQLVSTEEAFKLMEKTVEFGLISTITHCISPHVYGICNCCTCCCVPYRLRKVYGIGQTFVNGYKLPQVNKIKCVDCKKCAEICPEKVMLAGFGVKETANCLGCGLCKASCPNDAVEMVKRDYV
jgi:Pyruvate/2-oxoacid:ferredoxin oxidoreductase delta subunit